MVTRELDLATPVQTRNKRRPKASSKWLSPEIICAKRLRRLEHRWKTSGLDTDQTTYRAACRMANKAINESRNSQHSQRISECIDSKQHWAIIKKHLTLGWLRQLAYRGWEPEAVSFLQRLLHQQDQWLEKDYRSLTATGSCFSGRTLLRHSTPNLPPVAPFEIVKLLSSIPVKYSPMDFIIPHSSNPVQASFSDLIAKLANLSFCEDHFPSCFKLAQVTPLLKKAAWIKILQQTITQFLT